MTNHELRFARDLDLTNGHERGLPCFVYHEDAGGRCAATATMRVYGLAFCEEHGEAAKLGALLEVFDDADQFFDRFRNPHTSGFSEVIERELLAAVDRMRGEGPADEDYQRAIARAYPDVPEKVRAGVLRWEEDTDYAREEGPADHLLDTLMTMHKLLRLAFESGECWLVETLEYEREAVAAQCAYALRDRHQERGEVQPRRAERDECKQREAERGPSGEILRRTNAALSTAVDLLDGVPPEVFGDEDDYWRTKRAITEAGSLVVDAEGRVDRPA